MAGTKHTAKLVSSHCNPPSEIGDVRVTGNTPGGHPADGMTAEVNVGDGAFTSIINPQSFANGGPEWVMRYGNPESLRYSVASLLASYDYLLCDDISTTEAIHRLRLLRSARTALSKAKAEGSSHA